MFALRDVSQNLANLETAANFLIFKKLSVGSSYSQVSLKYLDMKAKLAVFAFINGYALEKAQMYAKSHAFDFVLRCIENCDEKLAIEAINADGLLTRLALKKLLPVASSAGMVEAVAIITERTAPKAEKPAQAISH